MSDISSIGRSHIRPYLRSNIFGSKHGRSFSTNSRKIARDYIGNGTISINGIKFNFKENSSLKKIAKNINSRVSSTKVGAKVIIDKDGYNRILLKSNRKIVKIIDYNKVLHSAYQKKLIGKSDNTLIQIARHEEGNKNVILRYKLANNGAMERSSLQNQHTKNNLSRIVNNAPLDNIIPVEQEFAMAEEALIMPARYFKSYSNINKNNFARVKNNILKGEVIEIAQKIILPKEPVLQNIVVEKRISESYSRRTSESMEDDLIKFSMADDSDESETLADRKQFRKIKNQKKDSKKKNSLVRKRSRASDLLKTRKRFSGKVTTLRHKKSYSDSNKETTIPINNIYSRRDKNNILKNRDRIHKKSKTRPIRSKIGSKNQKHELTFEYKKKAVFESLKVQDQIKEEIAAFQYYNRLSFVQKEKILAVYNKYEREGKIHAENLSQNIKDNYKQRRKAKLKFTDTNHGGNLSKKRGVVIQPKHARAKPSFANRYIAKKQNPVIKVPSPKLEMPASFNFDDSDSDSDENNNINQLPKKKTSLKLAPKNSNKLLRIGTLMDIPSGSALYDYNSNSNSNEEEKIKKPTLKKESPPKLEIKNENKVVKPAKFQPMRLGLKLFDLPSGSAILDSNNDVNTEEKIKQEPKKSPIKKTRNSKKTKKKGRKHRSKLANSKNVKSSKRNARNRATSVESDVVRIKKRDSFTSKLKVLRRRNPKLLQELGRSSSYDNKVWSKKDKQKIIKLYNDLYHSKNKNKIDDKNNSRTKNSKTRVNMKI